MDRLAIVQGPKLLNQRLDFAIKDKIETIDRMAMIQGPTIVEKTVRFFN